MMCNWFRLSLCSLISWSVQATFAFSPLGAQLFLINSQVYFLKYGPLSRLDASLTLGVSFSLFQLSPVEKRLSIVFLGPSTSFALA